MSQLKVSIVQTDLIWENAIQSREHIEKHLSSVQEKTDIILLPEMFTTGFTMNTEQVAETFDIDRMETLNWMRVWAKKLDAVITGSVSIKENDKCYNRLLWVRPDGTFSNYDKRHTFTFAEEDKHYASGGKLLIEEWRGWNICPLICYDLRFPVWNRNRIVDGKPMYDVLIYLANWPMVRREPWKKLLLARAIENQCYVAACNRVGTDYNNHEYSGDSSFINPRGEYIHELTPSKEEVITVALSKDELDDFRKKFPVLNDADAFNLK